MEIALTTYEDSGTGVWSDSNLSDIGYAGDGVPLNEDSSKLQTFCDHLSGSVSMFGMRFIFEV